MASRRTLLKVVILGDAGVGKTCLLQQYIKKQFSMAYKATIGADFLSKELVIDKTIITFQLWDTAGQEQHNAMAASFYRNSECCVLVFDLTDPNSFEKVETWRSEFLKQLEPKDPDSYPFVLLGNKCDKTDDIKVVQSKIDMYTQSKGNMPYFQTSAKDNLNVDKAFQEVANLAFKRTLKDDVIFQPTKVDLKKPTTVQNKTCCNL